MDDLSGNCSTPRLLGSQHL